MSYTLVPSELIVDGAITSAKLDTNISISGTLGVTGELTLATHLNMGDNDKIKIGTGGDLEIYHDGSNSYIANSTGNIYIADTNGAVHIQAKLNEESIVAAADGAVTLYHDNSAKLATASAGVTVTGTLTPSGVLTANAGVVVDNITIDGNEIDVSSGDLTLDVAGDIVLDADGAEIILADGGTQFANLKNSSSDFEIKSLVQDKDIKFIGNDNNSDVTALALDMSEAGAATFNAGITAGGNVTVTSATATTNGMVRLQNNMDNNYETLRIESLGNFDAHIGFFADGDSNYFWGLGVDYSDSGKFKLANDNLLATNTRLTITTDGQIQSRSLGVSTPTFSFDNDTDTGMTRPTADTLQFVCGGTVKNRISSDGLLFNSDTAAANALDDYEEGTWTPTFQGATLSTAVGNYTKIGNQVTVHYTVVTTGGLPSSGTQVQVGGLPFAQNSGNLSAGSVYARYYTPNDSTLTMIVQDGESVIRYININEESFDYTLMGELEVVANNSIYTIGTITYIV